MNSSAVATLDEQQLVIRRAHGGDLEDVAYLLDFLGYPREPHAMRNIFHTVTYDPQINVLVATMGPEAVGLISVRVFPSLRLNGYEAVIEELVVHPLHRGRGIGKMLLNSAMEFAGDHGVVRVEVQTSHKRESYRRRFYEKNGFIRAESTIYRVEPSPEAL